MSEILDVPAGLIMKAVPPHIEVFQSSRSPNNPYKIGQRDILAGLFCETTIKDNKKLLVPNALTDLKWGKDNPDVQLGMISYLGFLFGGRMGMCLAQSARLIPKKTHTTNAMWTSFKGSRK